MSSFTDPLKVEVLDRERGGRGLFRVLEPFTYEVGHLGSGEKITVQAGYVTDFASVPRGIAMIAVVVAIGAATLGYTIASVVAGLVAIFIMLTPISGRSAKAAVLHDWLMRYRDLRATQVFNEALKVAGTPAWRRWPMVAFVAAFTFMDLRFDREHTPEMPQG